jgi:hypothetical protein
VFLSSNAADLRDGIVGDDRIHLVPAGGTRQTLTLDLLVARVKRDRAQRTAHRSVQALAVPPRKRRQGDGATTQLMSQPPMPSRAAANAQPGRLVRPSHGR